METKYIKKKNFIINTIYFLLILLIIYVFIKYVVSLLAPFIIALFIAFLINKPAYKIAFHTKIPKKIVSFFMVLIVYGLAGVILSLVGVKLISTISNLISTLPELYENKLSPFLLETFNNIEKNIDTLDPVIIEALNNGFDQFVNSLGKNISNISIAIVSSISGIASSLPGILIKILLMIISTFFISIDFEILSTFVKKQLSTKANEILNTTKLFIGNTLFVVIRSYLLIMSITFVELSISLSIIKMPYALLIACIIAIFDILPVLGTGGIMIPWSIISFLQGDFRLGISLAIIYLFVTVMRNVLEPKIVGSQLGIHPVVALVGMFVGLKVLGVIGLFGAPITLALIKHLNDSGAVKLYNK